MKQNTTVYVYDVDGSSTTIEHDGEHDIFRKVLKTHDESNMTEFRIAEMLLETPQPNVVKIYNAVLDGDICYIDMEYLDDKYVPFKEYEVDFKKGLNQLHSLGIVYIDIKQDNIGYSTKDKVFKIFDFDCSGIVCKDNTKAWLCPPIEGFKYRSFKHHEPTLHTLFDLDMLCWEHEYKKKYIM